LKEKSFLELRRLRDEVKAKVKGEAEVEAKVPLRALRSVWTGRLRLR
jgi:hypothetical protein